MKETAERCQDGSPVMPAGQGWLTEVKSMQRGAGSIGYRGVCRGKKDWYAPLLQPKIGPPYIVRYMLPTQCKAFHKEYEDTRLSLSPSVATHTHTANSCILLTTNRRMMSSWFRWIRSKRVSTSAILLSTPTPANRKYIAARGTACSRTKTTDTIPCNKCCLQWQL